LCAEDGVEEEVEGGGVEGGGPPEYIVCAWCNQKGLKLFTLKTGTGSCKAFCSEVCFTQCRRTSFKKNKVSFFVIVNKNKVSFNGRQYLVVVMVQNNARQ
jgi:hypothetical protein